MAPMNKGNMIRKDMDKETFLDFLDCTLRFHGLAKDIILDLEQWRYEIEQSADGDLCYASILRLIEDSLGEQQCKKIPERYKSPPPEQDQQFVFVSVSGSSVQSGPEESLPSIDNGRPVVKPSWLECTKNLSDFTFTTTANSFSEGLSWRGALSLVENLRHGHPSNEANRSGAGAQGQEPVEPDVGEGWEDSVVTGNASTCYDR